MKSFRTSLAALAAAGAFLVVFPARAQLDSQRIVIRQRPVKTNLLKLKAEVIRFDGRSITVRERDNPTFVHTFTFAPEIQGKMEQLLERGGYRFGDRVEVRYQAGQTVAQEIKGKPSRPI